MATEPRIIGESADTPSVCSDSGAGPAGASEPGPALPPETGGRAGPEPTRYGDWEKNGRCIDF